MTLIIKPHPLNVPGISDSVTTTEVIVIFSETKPRFSAKTYTL